MKISTYRRSARSASLCLFLAVIATGCSSIGGLIEGERIDYKSAKKPATNLEVPPDLTQLQQENRYSLPSANQGVATASGFNARPARQTAAASDTVLPQVENIRLERAGNQRWLVVQQSPEVLWPRLKEFWQQNGFLIHIESKDSGVMETDWAENRAKIPQDFIRNTIGRAFDALYSTGERDKFRTRLERGADGVTEIFVSHRGAEEVVSGRERETTVWTPRASDPELEAAFLARMMAFLGGESKKEAVQTAMKQGATQPERARLVNGDEGSLVQVSETFDRAWRRVGLALDRVGFTVEDRDRSQGVYFVRYVNPNQDAQSKPAAEKGFLARWFGSSDKDKAKTAQRYQIVVKPAGEGSQVAVLDNTGKRDSSSAANRILTLLNDQLK